jgi:cellulose synthase/poly-beta-1,6-N-acetylglucosamine synthase-like glycosyltransferase
VTLRDLAWALFVGFNGLVLLYFLAINLFYLATSLHALATLRRYALRVRSLDLSEVLSLGGAPPITLLAPAYNEEATCVEATRSLLNLQYPDYEVVVVNDGSRDHTLARLAEAFQLTPAARFPSAHIPTEAVRGVWRSQVHPNLWVIDKANGGKADALNAGLNHARTPLVCAMDADSLLEREALARIVRPFLEDDRTVAVGGIIRIANGCTVEAGRVTRVAMPRNWLARIQVLEYLRAFLAGRVGWAAVDATMIISGAFGLFRRGAVVAAGGWDRTTVGEDMELIVRLHRHCRERREPYRITFVPDPVAWTECPESLRVLGRQRERWQRGLTETLWRHRGMLFNPRYGRIGMVVYPYFYFLEMLGPAIEVGGYLAFALALALGIASWPYILAFLSLALVFGVALSLAAVALEELSFRRYPRMLDLVSLFALAVMESLGYRQLSTWWRARGLVAALRGKRGWGDMTRKGFSNPKPA